MSNGPLLRALAGRHLAEWVILGASIADGNERGIVHRDLGPHNIGLSPDGELVIYDTGTRTRIAFPQQAEVLAVSLFPLLAELPLEFGAAFRFGYLHHLGPTARTVVDILRREHRLHSFRASANVAYRPDRPAATAGRLDLGAHREWVAVRGSVEEGDLHDEFAVDLAHRLRAGAELDRRGAELRRDGERVASRYVYEKRLVIAVATESTPAIAATLGNLATLLGDARDFRSAFGYVLYGLTLVSAPPVGGGNAGDDVHAWLLGVAADLRRRGPAEHLDLVEKLLSTESMFLWLWNLDDLAAGDVKPAT